MLLGETLGSRLIGGNCSCGDIQICQYIYRFGNINCNDDLDGNLFLSDF